MKQMRGRGGRGGRGNGFNAQLGGSQQGGGYMGPSPEMLMGFPALPDLSNMPQFDPNDPMAAIMAMQAMGLPPLPGMEGLLPQQTGAQRSSGYKSKEGKGVCRDYVNKGFCTRGDACPYQHTNPVIMPGQEDGEIPFGSKIVTPAEHYDAEYDPKDSLIADGPFSPTSLANGNQQSDHSSPNGFPNEFRGRGRGSTRGRGRGRGGSERGGFHKPNRADFSHASPNHDRAITTIVVEQIPEEKFSEDAVRECFTEFGTIDEVTMQPYKRLAIVKYTDYNFARAAYDSPKAIFDNRFVKVYWYKPGSLPTPASGTSTFSTSVNGNNDTTMQESSPPIDMEAFTAAATAAQAKLDAKKAALAASQSQREALEKQKADLALKQAAEKQRLLDRLAAKGVLPDGLSDNSTSIASLPPVNNESNENKDTNDATTPKAGDSAHTLMLRAKVAELEAEAKRLGLPDSALVADTSPSTFSPRGRGRGRGRGARGSYRGWEAFDSASSSYRGGRGGAGGGGGGSPFVPARGGGSGKYNLDLRTKRVAVTLPTPDPASNDGGSIKDADQGPQKWTAERDEALRQHLLGVGEFEDILPLSSLSGNDKDTPADNHTAQAQGSTETLIVVFKDRSTAESFLYGVKGKDIPGLGKLGVSWFNTPTPAAPAPSTSSLQPGGSISSSKKTKNGVEAVNTDVEMENNSLVMDHDVQTAGHDDAAGGQWEVGAVAKPLTTSPGTPGGSGGGEHDSGGSAGLVVEGAEGDYDVAEEDDDDRWMT